MEYRQARAGMKVRPTKLAKGNWKTAYADLGAFTISRVSDSLSQIIYCRLPGRDEEYPFQPREITNVGVEE